jgi:hypothetical protein|tara:strand:- start:4166 stop:4306 length:141 start_codon:yes stop_codon:yes gene_type:complete
MNATHLAMQKMNRIQILKLSILFFSNLNPTFGIDSLVVVNYPKGEL